MRKFLRRSTFRLMPSGAETAGAHRTDAKEGHPMSALRWPVFTSAEIHEALRLALATSPLARPPEANFRCAAEPGAPGLPQPGPGRQHARGILTAPSGPVHREGAGVTCLGDERNRADAP
ncbi:hypothetical protein [Candidatus Solirubrobacter pratensis]|uniref:hypothetical protein n=1 Tax=Candidatus Solirubrobacter pratensis TaxID=1298857 RepID=UPI0004815FF5|nr:hypothetical protein [Candidatus Solirubrobacter pratensis]